MYTSGISIINSLTLSQFLGFTKKTQIFLKKMKNILTLLFILSWRSVSSSSLPNIFFVIVDDFGWGDSGWHREDPEIVTPTMNELVRNGIELDRHYVHPMCTPSRSSFQSGRLPVHILQKLVGPCDKNGAIPRNITGIAAYVLPTLHTHTHTQ